MENISQMSLVEVALEIMKKKTGPQNIHTLIREVLELKGIDGASIDAITQLYIDITTSSKFVYMGNDEWDLKIRQSLDQFDKDGSAFNSKNDLDDEELDSVDDIIDLDEDLDEDEEDEDLDEDDEDDDEDDLDSEDDEDLDEDDLVDDETELDDEGNPVERYSEDDDDDFDEDEYNDIMDDYEDMY